MYFAAAMEQLRDRYLNIALETGTHPASVPAIKTTAEQEIAASEVLDERPPRQYFMKDLDVFDESGKHIFSGAKLRELAGVLRHAPLRTLEREEREVILYRVSRNGQVYGPYTLEDVVRYVASGNIDPFDLVKSDNMTQWISVSQMV